MKNTKIILLISMFSILLSNHFASAQLTDPESTVTCSLTYHKMNPGGQSGEMIPGSTVEVTAAGVTTENNGFILNASLIPPGCGPVGPCWSVYRFRLSISKGTAANNYMTSFKPGITEEFDTDLILGAVSTGTESATAECWVK